MSKNEPPRKALGKGLHSLLPSRSSSAAAVAPIREENVNGKVLLVPIDHLQPNPDQPRREFDPTALLELSQSIGQDGIIQPIIVRKTGPNAYQIIAGERRWRAAKTAGLAEVPVIPREADDHKVLELAIVENIQRSDLNPIELALAFHRMAEDLGLSHDEIGEKTGQNRATISNTIRLLQLPKDLQELVASGRLSAGHARALLKIEDEAVQRQTADRSVREGWSVRQMEEFTRPERTAKSGPDNASAKPSIPAVVDPNVKAAIAELERVLGTRVRISEKGREKGTIEIEYYSSQDLDRIYGIIVPDSL